MELETAQTRGGQKAKDGPSQKRIPSPFCLPSKRYFKVEFIDDTWYKLYYRDDQNGQWVQDSNLGFRGEDSVFPEAKAFILKHWWEGGMAGPEDRLYFETNPDAKVVGMPVLFRDVGGAVAFTNNHVNALIDGTRAITAVPYGPMVDWQKNGIPSDLFSHYVSAAFQKTGATALFFDERAYHNGAGSIHCATNVIREIPSEEWWQ